MLVTAVGMSEGVSALPTARVLLLAALLAQCYVLGHGAHAPKTSTREGWRLPVRSGLEDGQALAHASIYAHNTDYARAIEKLLLRVAIEWNFTFSSSSQASVSHSGEPDLVVHLTDILTVTSKLIENASSCNGDKNPRRILTGSGDVDGTSGDGGVDQGSGGDCPAPAPELLQGRTSAFLASLLRTYPRGPTSRQDMVTWAAAATAFLQEHASSQRLQQKEAAEVAAAAADTAVAKAAAAAAAEKPKSEKSEGKDDKPRGSGPRRELAADKGGGDYKVGSADYKVGSADAAPKLPGADYSGVQYGGLPLVRRVLLSQLLLGWMTSLHRELVGTPHLALEASAVVHMLYGIHVESVAQRALVEYFHISKAGGTSWATAASANGCRNPRATSARVGKFDDECRWINGTLMRELGLQVVTRTGARQVCSRFDVTARMTPPSLTDCEGRWRYALSKGYQYIANEYTLPGGLARMNGTHICPQFVNVISIREPLARLSSNVKYMLLRLHSQLFRSPPLSGKFEKLFCNAPASVWEAYAPPVADNYNIRTLVGERGFHTPLYGIGEAHEALAKQLLLQYDLILDLNAGDKASDLVMRQGLGWNKTLTEVHVWTSDRLARQSGLDLQNSCRVGDIKPLLARQVYDQRWYSFGRALARLDQLFLSAAAQLGSSPWPENWEASSRGGGAGRGLEGAASGRKKRPALRCGLMGSAEALWPRAKPAV